MVKSSIFKIEIDFSFPTLKIKNVIYLEFIWEIIGFGDSRSIYWAFDPAKRNNIGHLKATQKYVQNI